MLLLYIEGHTCFRFKTNGVAKFKDQGEQTSKNFLVLSYSFLPRFLLNRFL